MSHKIVKSVSFNSEEHKRILERAEATGNFSGAVQAALTAYFSLERGVTLTMIYARQAEILRKLENGAVVVSSTSVDEEQGDELPGDILGAFD